MRHFVELTYAIASLLMGITMVKTRLTCILILCSVETVNLRLIPSIIFDRMFSSWLLLYVLDVRKSLKPLFIA
jgi:hypothetical protein